MNNSDLANRISADLEITKTDARAAVDGIFAAIGEAVATGKEVSIAGFGKFKIKRTAEREGRNPATGASITIAAGKKLGFAPAKSVKIRLNG